MVSKSQRKTWADYFIKNKINFVFFSAALAQIELQIEQEKEEEMLNRLSPESTVNVSIDMHHEQSDSDESNDEGFVAETHVESKELTLFNRFIAQKVARKEKVIVSKNTMQILTVHELILLFSQECPFITQQQTIGFVGYPNVFERFHFKSIIQ